MSEDLVQISTEYRDRHGTGDEGGYNRALRRVPVSRGETC